jgi:glycosyltransferase involved in cell wall biosynthesis
MPSLGGLAISEAMAHGLPVLVTEADGCEVDLVEPGRNGYILPLGDQQAFEQTLADLLDDPEKARAMGQHSRWIIENRYNIHTYMENVVRALEFACRRRPSPRGQAVMESAS